MYDVHRTYRYTSIRVHILYYTDININNSAIVKARLELRDVQVVYKVIPHSTYRYTMYSVRAVPRREFEDARDTGWGLERRHGGISVAFQFLEAAAKL